MSNTGFPVQAPSVQYKNGKSSGTRTLVIVLIVVAILGVLTAGGAFALYKFRENNKVFYVPSESMTPTLQVNDKVRTSKLSSSSTIKRGEIVIVKAPKQVDDKNVQDVIKRVVGMPGETIESRDGKVYINNKLLTEPYLATGTPTEGIEKTVIPEGQYFLMGDNRSNSADSRAYGPIARSTFEYKAVDIVLPLDHRKSL